jgi:hypothetical protein
MRYKAADTLPFYASKRTKETCYLLVSYLIYSTTLKIDEGRSFEISEDFYWAIR